MIDAHKPPVLLYITLCPLKDLGFNVTPSIVFICSSKVAPRAQSAVLKEAVTANLQQSLYLTELFKFPVRKTEWCRWKSNTKKNKLLSDRTKV